jgi:hypothetical protein
MDRKLFLPVAELYRRQSNNPLQTRRDFSRKLKWIRPILAAKNNLAINARGCPHERIAGQRLRPTTWHSTQAICQDNLILNGVCAIIGQQLYL